MHVPQCCDTDQPWSAGHLGDKDVPGVEQQWNWDQMWLDTPRTNHVLPIYSTENNRIQILSFIAYN